MNLKLIKLTEEYKDALVEMIDEWKADIEKNHTHIFMCAFGVASLFRLYGDQPNRTDCRLSARHQ